MPDVAGADDAIELEDLPVLIVDDEADQRRAVVRLLEPTGWTTVVCSDPAEALRRVEEREFSVVLSDFRMPGMDGVELLTRVLERRPDAERILMTGNADAEALERGVNEARISRFVKKPWEPEVLLAIVSEARQMSSFRRERALLLERLRQRNQELSYLNDLLGQRVAESSLAILRFRRRWDVALNAISDPILLVGADYRIEGANEAAAALAGRSAEDLEGRRCHETLFRSARPCEGCPLEPGQGRVVAGGSARTFDARAYRLPGVEGSHLCVYRDVTRELAFQREAAHFEKMAAIGRLSGSVAHELNNPLHGILSFVQLAQKPDVTPDKLARYLEVIRECAVRCRDIVQAMRDFSRRPGPRERKVFDVRVACEKALVLFGPVLGERLQASLGGVPAPCVGNANSIQQVLTNLIQNAIDASPNDGVVRVSVEKDGDAIVIAVEDEGPGVPEEERERIFEPFYTTKPEGMGTGLGLAISHGIIQDHQGTLRVRRSELGGARFEARLPRARAAEEAGRVG